MCNQCRQLSVVTTIVFCFNQVVLLNADPNNPAPFAAFLDLDTFDNTEYDIRTPEEWLSIGVDDGVRKPIPAKALLPAKNPIYPTCKLPGLL